MLYEVVEAEVVGSLEVCTERKRERVEERERVDSSVGGHRW